jgi:hypothetical protein
MVTRENRLRDFNPGVAPEGSAMSFIRMNLHIGDYKKSTGHLRAAGHGAYALEKGSQSDRGDDGSGSLPHASRHHEGPQQDESYSLQDEEDDQDVVPFRRNRK